MTADAGSVRMLFVRHSAGFNHSSRDAASTALSAIAVENGFALTVSDDAPSAIDSLGDFDVLVFFTSGELPLSAAQKTAMLQFVERGGGFVGFHSATDTFYQWPEYNELVGAWFDGHPWTQEVTVRVDAPDSGIVAPLSPSFRISDEIYQFRDWRSDNVVLLSLDTSSVDLNAAGVKQNAWGFPVAWTRSYGSGRVFYLSLGHPESTWADSRIRSVISRAVRYSAGR